MLWDYCALFIWNNKVAAWDLLEKTGSALELQPIERATWDSLSLSF